MTEKTHAVPNGVIHYWMNDFQPGRAVLVFLPGLTAHRAPVKSLCVAASHAEGVRK